MTRKLMKRFIFKSSLKKYFPCEASRRLSWITNNLLDSVMSAHFPRPTGILQLSTSIKFLVPISVQLPGLWCLMVITDN